MPTKKSPKLAMGRKPRYPGQEMATANIYARKVLIEYLVRVGLQAGAPKRGALGAGVHGGAHRHRAVTPGSDLVLCPVRSFKSSTPSVIIFLIKFW